MRTEGKRLAEIAKVFGLKSEDDVKHRVAVGKIPDLGNGDLQVIVSFLAVRDYILPLRIEIGRNPEDGNERLYDYSEVSRCIELLISGELSREDLPSYSRYESKFLATLRTNGHGIILRLPIA